MSAENKLAERQKALLAEARGIMDLKDTEDFNNGGVLEITPDQQKRFDAIMSEVDAISKRRAVLKTLDLRAAEQDDDDKEEQEDNERQTRSRGRVSSPNAPDYIKHAEKSGYNLAGAIKRFLDNGGRFDGVEKEISDELAKRRRGNQRGNLLIPYRAKVNPVNPANVNRRALDTTTYGVGLVPTFWESFIDVLRPKLVTNKVGVRFMDNLPAGIKIPRFASASTTYWIGEGGSPTASQQTTNNVTLNPHTVCAQVDITRRLIIESVENAQQLVTEDITKVLAVEIDKQFFIGAGTNNTPVGLFNDSSAQIYTISQGGGYATWGAVVALEQLVETANALEGKLAYVTSPKGRAQLKTISRTTAGYPQFLMSDDGTMNGYPVVTSSQIPSILTESPSGSNLTALVFGNWDDAIIGSFGEGLDCLVDPYSVTDGGVRIKMYHDCDFAFRHDQSWAMALDMKTQ